MRASGGGDCTPTVLAPVAVYCHQGNGIDRAGKCLTAYSFDSLSSNSMKSKNPHSGCRAVEIAKTLDTGYPDPSKNQGGIAIVEKIILDDQGWKEDTSYTLNTIDKPAVVCAQKSYTEFKDESTLSTLKATGGSYGGGSENTVVKNYIVRRLTPTECARLQGFPSWWGIVNPVENLTDEDYAFWLDVRNTYAEINGKATKEYTREQMLAWYNKLHSDSAEYKMWGNGIALPNALYVMQGIAEVVGVHHSK